MNWLKIFKFWDKFWDRILLPSVTIAVLVSAFFEKHYTKWLFILLLLLSLPSAIYKRRR